MSNVESMTSVNARGFVIVRGALYDYNGSDSEVIIPESVTSIGDNAFYNCTNLSRAVIPENVTAIGEKAFFGCKKLAELTLSTNTGGSISKFCPKTEA